MAEQPVDLRRRDGGGPGGRSTGPACLAPFASLYLDPVGRVTACCANTWHPLGDLRHERLADVWRGEPARRLRERLAAGDLGLGCELCAAEVARGAGASAERRRFDPLGAVVPAGPAATTSDLDPAYPVQLELALSNACNLQCVMCNGELSSAIRVHREGRPPLPPVYDDAFFADLDAFLPHLRRVFLLGGEPFLGAEPLRVLDRLVELGLTPDVYVTTNGTQWSPRVERLLGALPIDVSISVDGFRAETVASIRVGVRHDELVRNIDRYRAAARGNGGGFSLTFCLQRGNWRELGEVLAWGDRLDALVGVSTLTNPPHLGLHGLPTAELEAVARALHAEAVTRAPALGRNRGAWEAALARVDGLVAERATTGPTDAAWAAGERAAAWADGRGVHRIHADGAQLVQAVEPRADDVFGADLRGLVGGPTRAFTEALRGALGPVDDTALVVHPDGVEERRLRFGATEVRAWLAPEADGDHVWVLAARDHGGADRSAGPA